MLNAFISYSHTADLRVAAAVPRGLERTAQRARHRRTFVELLPGASRPALCRNGDA